MRSAFFQLRDYYESYGWSVDSAYNAIDKLMEEACYYGVNFANARNEIGRMSVAQLINGPENGQQFVEVSKRIRTNSLHLIAGGFRTDPYESDHNDAVIDYLSQYVNWAPPGGWPRGSGSFLGVFGFDEPDAKFEGPGWNQCQYNWPYWKLVDIYAQACRQQVSEEDVFPFGTFLDRWCTKDGDSLYYQNTIPLFCEELDFPVFDKYPCNYNQVVNRTYPDQIESDEIIGATDLLPSGNVDYAAYASQDEIFAVSDDGWFRVFEFANVTSHTDTLEVSRVDSIQLPQSLRIDPVWAASDFRTMDVGDRSSSTHRLNGAVVFCNQYDPEDQMVISHNGTEIVHLEDCLEMPTDLLTTTAVCVGEYNYPLYHDSQADRRGSLISHGELRILVCFTRVEGPRIVNRARIYSWNYNTEEFEDVTGTSPGLVLDILPAGAVWGVFWPTHDYWWNSDSDDQSGFIVYDSNGSYQSIYEYLPGNLEPEWAVSDEHSGLFPMDERSFSARRSGWFPHFTAGMDYICHLKSSVNVDEVILEFASCPGGSPDVELIFEESDPFELPEPYIFSGINDACCWRPLKVANDEVLLVSIDDGSGGSNVYRSTSSINFKEGNGLHIDLDSIELTTSATDESPLLSTARVYNVRRPYRVPFVFNPEEGVYPYQIELIGGDISVETSSDQFASQHEAYDTMFVYGIDGTDRDNCLMPNLRCAGRRQDGQLTYYAREDSLLYLTTCAVVHGCRGIHLRALDLTMMCGNWGIYPSPDVFRCPPLLLNWGPSIETVNVDMLSRIHNVVQMLTGRNTDNPDFLSALISEDWNILDSDEAENAWYLGSNNWQTDADNDSLNFITLKESLSNDILLLVVNDSAEKLDFFEWTYYFIHFPYENTYKYTPHYIAGFQCDMYYDISELALNFYEMPPYTASLYWIEWTP